MADTTELKKNRATQRLFVTAELGPAPANLDGKTVEVYLAKLDQSDPQLLTATVLNQAGGNVGKFSVDVTAANLTAIGTPSQALMVCNIWNADNSSFLWAQTVLDVVL